MGSKREFGKKEIREIMRLREEKKSYTHIGKIFGCRGNTISRIFNRNAGTTIHCAKIPEGATTTIGGINYKIGRFGYVYRLNNDAWYKSTVTHEQIAKQLQSGKKRRERQEA